MEITASREVKSEGGVFAWLKKVYAFEIHRRRNIYLIGNAGIKTHPLKRIKSIKYLKWG